MTDEADTPEPIRLRPYAEWQLTDRQRVRLERRLMLAFQLGDMRVLTEDGRVLVRWKGQRGWRRLWTLARMWRWKWLP